MHFPKRQRAENAPIVFFILRHWLVQRCKIQRKKLFRGNLTFGRLLLFIHLIVFRQHCNDFIHFSLKRCCIFCICWEYPEIVSRFEVVAPHYINAENVFCQFFFFSFFHFDGCLSSLVKLVVNLVYRDNYFYDCRYMNIRLTFLLIHTSYCVVVLTNYCNTSLRA